MGGEEKGLESTDVGLRSVPRNLHSGGWYKRVEREARKCETSSEVPVTPPPRPLPSRWGSCLQGFTSALLGPALFIAFVFASVLPSVK